MIFKNQTGDLCGASGNEPCVTCQEGVTVLDSYNNKCVPRDYATRGGEANGLDDTGPLVTCNDGTKDVSNGDSIPCINHGGVKITSTQAQNFQYGDFMKPQKSISQNLYKYVLVVGLLTAVIIVAKNMYGKK